MTAVQSEHSPPRRPRKGGRPRLSLSRPSPPRLKILPEAARNIPKPAIALEVPCRPGFAHEPSARSTHEKVSAAIPGTPRWSSRNRQRWLDNQPSRVTRTTVSPRCISRVSCHPAESSQPRSKETCKKSYLLRN